MQARLSVGWLDVQLTPAQVAEMIRTGGVMLTAEQADLVKAEAAKADRSYDEHGENR